MRNTLPEFFEVEILKTDKRLGIKAGERYTATRYKYDTGKVTLESRIPDGYDPCCNQYWNEVRVVVDAHD